MYKRLIAIMIACLMLLPHALADHKKPVVVGLNFPAYDLARAVTGDKADVSMLLKPGMESHSFEPSPQDILAIQNADLFIYTGGDNEHWVKMILESLGDKAPKTLAMADQVVVMPEEILPGMEHDHDHDEKVDGHGHEHENKADEHEHTERAVVLVCLDVRFLAGPDVFHGHPGQDAVAVKAGHHAVPHKVHLGVGERLLLNGLRGAQLVARLFSGDALSGGTFGCTVGCCRGKPGGWASYRAFGYGALSHSGLCFPA